MATFLIVFGSIGVIFSLSYLIYTIRMEDKLYKEKFYIDEINYYTYQIKQCQRRVETYKKNIKSYQDKLSILNEEENKTMEK